jgi:uncharacterized iron-regulated membrane protein
VAESLELVEIQNWRLPALWLSCQPRAWNRHSVIGFWAAIPLTFIVLTGAILSYSWATNLLYFVTGSPAKQASSAEDRAGKGPRHGSSASAPGSLVKCGPNLQERPAAGNWLAQS